MLLDVTLEEDLGVIKRRDECTLLERQNRMGCNNLSSHDVALPATCVLEAWNAVKI